MAPQRPRVTIAIPTYNRRPFLERALDSALAQTHPDIQIVISDDGSTDTTAAYLDAITDPRVVVLRSPNQGIAANYNRCLQAAAGEFILLLNDDDWLMPTAIAELTHAFLHPPANVDAVSIGVAWAPCTVVDAAGLALWNTPGGPPLETSVDLIEGLFNGLRSPICSSTMLRTADALAAGGFDPAYLALVDSSVLGRVALRRPFAVCVDRSLMSYRVHSDATTSAAACSAWRQLVQMQAEDFVQLLQLRGDAAGAQRLRRASRHALANITATVLMRAIARPGWFWLFLREFWTSRSLMLTPYVLHRAFRDGWKILRLLSPRRSMPLRHSPDVPAAPLIQSQTYHG